MPPKNDLLNAQQNKDGGAKKPRKKFKTRKKKEDCPSLKRKTDRVVIKKQAREIIAKVYEFMKQEASSEYAEKLTNARWRCAHACGVSEKTVTRILKEKRKAIAAAAGSGGSASAVVDGKVGLTTNATQTSHESHMEILGHGSLQNVGMMASGPGATGHLDLSGKLEIDTGLGKGTNMISHGSLQNVGMMSSGPQGAAKEMEHINNAPTASYATVGTNTVGNMTGQDHPDAQGPDVLVNAAGRWFF